MLTNLQILVKSDQIPRDCRLRGAPALGARGPDGAARDAPRPREKQPPRFLHRYGLRRRRTRMYRTFKA